MQRGWVGDVADLFFFWISKAASRHNCSSKLGKFCSRFVVGWASLRGLAGSGAAKVRHLFGLCKAFGRKVWKWRWFLTDVGCFEMQNAASANQSRDRVEWLLNYIIKMRKYAKIFCKSHMIVERNKYLNQLLESRHNGLTKVISYHRNTT